MPITAACPKCNKKYNLPDKMMGRPVKCTSCATQFKTPSQANSRPDSRQAEAQRQAQAAAQQQANELKKMGVEGAIQRAPDVFDGLTPMQGSADPLANHSIEDPGFGEANYTATKKSKTSDSDDPMAGMFENPAIEKKKKPKGSQAGNNKKTKSNTGKKVWISIGAVVVIGAVAACLYFFVL